jgi:hypothetical protein
MIWTMMNSDGQKLRIAPCSTSTVTPCEFAALEQTNLSPTDIVAWLNATERGRLSERGKLHKNAKRAYPFWKICGVCSTVFPCATREQAKRNRTCGKVCRASLFARTFRPKPPVLVTLVCRECGEEFETWPAWARRGRVYCSARCNGKVRGRALVAHPRHGEGKVAPEAIAKRAAKMRGANNPAWKGGVTLLHRKGNYPKQERLVRCPERFASMARKNGYVLEHRLVVATALNRPLGRLEVVHHIDHDPSNNALGNLMLFASNKDHKLYEAHGTPAPMWSGSAVNGTPARSGV